MNEAEEAREKAGKRAAAELHAADPQTYFYIRKLARLGFSIDAVTKRLRQRGESTTTQAKAAILVDHIQKAEGVKP